MRWSLASFRFLTVAILVFLLLGPLVRHLDKEVEPPIIVLAVDNSSSLVLGADSVEMQTRYPEMINSLRSDLGANYEVVTYTFGQDVMEESAPDFSEPITDLSALFQSLKNRYANRNLGAVILASDGIYNRGANPRYTTGGLSAPIYTIALGDTSVKRDARIAEVALNRIAFLGNRFPVEAVLDARKLQGKTMNFSVVSNGKTMHTESIKIDSEDFSKTVRVLIDADAPGRQQYTLRIAPIDGEATLANNTRSVFIDVIDSRQQVLILAKSPHPDIQALRAAITSNENYQVTVKLADAFDGNFSAYNLVILHQLPTIGNTSENIRTSLLQTDLPLFTIVGSQTLVPMLSRFAAGVDLKEGKSSFNDVGAIVNPSFSAFKLDQEFNNFLKDAPPLRTPFGEWRVANSSETILNQSVGRIQTEEPLLLINRMGERKTATLLGEGIWRWRLYNYATAENHEQFDKFIGSIVQYLALQADKRLFRLQHENRFMENERIIFSAELYNDAYEPVNDAEVNIVFRDSDEKSYPFTFSRTDNAYRLDAGVLPVGNYTYRATVNRAGEKFEETGGFSVEPFALEAANLTADHNLLYTLSSNSGGAMFYPNDLSGLRDALTKGNQLKPVSYTTEILSSVLNLRWPFFIILLLLSVEWFLRKRSGAY